MVTSKSRNITSYIEQISTKLSGFLQLHILAWHAKNEGRFQAEIGDGKETCKTQYIPYILGHREMTFFSLLKLSRTHNGYVTWGYDHRNNNISNFCGG